jgi:2-keto-4-pentenoate hydratase
MSRPTDDARIMKGMEAQLALRRSRLEAGEMPVGWKTGFGAPASLESLGIDAPLVGFLTERSILASEATVPVGGWARALVEPEIAVYFGRDLAVAGPEQTRAAISAIGPAIELADANSPMDDVVGILSGNIFHRHVILGRADASRAGCVLDGLVGRIYRDGEEFATVTEPQALTGDLVGVVQHVARLLSAFGEKVRAGEYIITGSIVPPLGFSGKEEIRYTLDPVDTVSVNLEA